MFDHGHGKFEVFAGERADHFHAFEKAGECFGSFLFDLGEFLFSGESDFVFVGPADSFDGDEFLGFELFKEGVDASRAWF